MGFMDFMKGKKDKESSKGQSIVDAFKQKHGKNTEPFANKEEMKEAFDNLVNSAMYQASTAFIKKTNVTTTLTKEAEAFAARAFPVLKNNSKVFKKVVSSIAILLFTAALSSCNADSKCLYCKEHNIDHDLYGDSYVEVSQGEPSGEDKYWVGGNKYPGNNGITSKPSDDKGHDYENKEDNDVTIEDNDKVQEEDNVVGGNGAVVEGNNNETIVVNGNVYYIYNEYNQVINVGDVNNPQGLTQEQFNKLMEILKELGLGSKDEVSKDETSKDDESSAPEKDPEVEEPEDNNQGGNGNQGNENVGSNGNQVAPEDMNAVDKFVSNSAWGIGKNVQVLRMYTKDLTMYDNVYPLGKAVDVYFDLSDGTTIAIPFDINVFNMINGGEGFVVERENLGQPSIVQSLSDMTYLYTHGQLPQGPTA